MSLLEKILENISLYIGCVQKDEFKINIKVNNPRLSIKSLQLLYLLLNIYEDLYFIVIEDLPCCLMPDTTEHIIYIKRPKRSYCYDSICKRCDFKKYCPGWPKLAYIDRDKINPPKDMPKEIVFELTTNCNLNCKTCALEKSQTLNLTFINVKQILDEAKSLGIRAIRFTGGEPLLNPDLKRILSYAKNNNFYVLLNTNATFDYTSKSRILGQKIDNVLLSLQGFDEKSDRMLTNSNINFSNKLINIIKLKSGIPVVRIGTVISRTFLNNMDKYYNLIKFLGIDKWELYRPIIKDKDKEFRINKKDLIKVMYFIQNLKKDGIKAKIFNPVPFCITDNLNLSLATLFGAYKDDGHSRIVFDTHGYFKPSYFINKNLGNTIRNAWSNPFLRKIRSLDYLPSRCRRCDYLKWCRGGSRAIAKIVNNNYFSVDLISE